jgi:xanthine dehydrogenase small subunit
MRTGVSALELLRPRTLEQALRMCRDEGALTPLAGCTDVYVLLQFGQPPGQRYLDLWALDELRGISGDDGVLRIGALATYTDMIRSAAVARVVPILAAAAREIGGVQIQNRGTLGGNIANGSPAGDTLPVLAVMEATIVLRSVDAERRVPFLEFYTGYRQNVMRRDELIVAIEMPRVNGAQWFRKVGTRAAQAISKVVMAGVHADSPRLALGSVAPTVVRLPRTETALSRGATIEEAKRVLLEEVQPIDDLRSTAEYRRRVAANLLARWWHDSKAT